MPNQKQLQLQAFQAKCKKTWHEHLNWLEHHYERYEDANASRLLDDDVAGVLDDVAYKLMQLHKRRPQQIRQYIYETYKNDELVLSALYNYRYAHEHYIKPSPAVLKLIEVMWGLNYDDPKF